MHVRCDDGPLQALLGPRLAMPHWSSTLATSGRPEATVTWGMASTVGNGPLVTKIRMSRVNPSGTRPCAAAASTAATASAISGAAMATSSASRTDHTKVHWRRKGKALWKAAASTLLSLGAPAATAASLRRALSTLVMNVTPMPPATTTACPTSDSGTARRPYGPVHDTEPRSLPAAAVCPSASVHVPGPVLRTMKAASVVAASYHARVNGCCATAEMAPKRKKTCCPASRRVSSGVFRRMRRNVVRAAASYRATTMSGLARDVATTRMMKSMIHSTSGIAMKMADSGWCKMAKMRTMMKL
mmetsp:Transcript_5933/g.18726  ORF Transcript_5933/g.18726 Transcript_5933/m.18726 type:complete len:301 (-) Transcript_5933:1156-2058(-)